MTNKLKIIVIYRPPKNSLSDFFIEFTTLLENQTSYGNNILIGGDFNIHVDKEEEKPSIEFGRILDIFGFIQNVVGETHEKGHTLDLIITRDSDSLHIAKPKINTLISDHFLITSEISFKVAFSTKKQITYRKIKDINIEHFKHDLENTHLVQLANNCNDPGILSQLYNNTLRALMDKHVPEITRLISLNHNDPWYNSKLLIEKRKRRALERKWRSTRDKIYLN